MTQTNTKIAFGSTDVTTLATGASVTLPGRMAGRGAQALSQVVLARALGPEVFGLYAIGWTLLRISGFIAPLGLDQGVIRYASQYRRASQGKLKGVLLQSLVLATLVGLMLGGSLYALAPWLASQVFQKPDLSLVIRWFSPAFSLVAGLKVAAAVTRVSQRMRYAVFSEDLLQPVSNLLLILLFSLLGWQLTGALAAGVLSYGLALGLALYYVWRIFSGTLSAQTRAVSAARELVGFSLPASLAGIFATLMSWTDRLLVGYFRPATEAGVYLAITQFSFLFVVVLNAFGAILAPMIADFHHQREARRLDELYKVSTKWGLYLSLPLFLVMSFAARELVIAVFGPGYESGALPLVILAVAQLTNVGTGAVGLLLIMTGHQSRWMLISGLMLLVNIGLDWLLIPRLGIIGAALTMAITMSGLFFGGLLYARRSLGVWPYDSRYLKGLLGAALAAGTLLLLRRMDTGPAVLSLALKSTLACGVYTATLVLLGLDAEDAEFLRLARARIRNAT